MLLKYMLPGKNGSGNSHIRMEKKTIDELVVPANEPVKLIMSSADVLHSFFLPNLRVKRDVIPNRYTILSFEATKLGNYNIFCTEYCGDQHSKMIAVLKVTDDSGYIDFLKEVDFDDSIPLSEAGKNIYTKRDVMLVILSMVAIWLGLHGKGFTKKSVTLQTEHQLLLMKYI